MVVLMTVPLLGLGLGALVAAKVSSDATEVTSETTWIPVDTSSLVGEQQVGLDLTWEEPVAVLSPGWSGLITAVFVAEGDAVTTGTPVVEVNGVRRVAYSAEKPLFGPVGADSRGVSRSTVSAFLSSLGYSTSGSAWNRSLLSGIRKFASDIGVPSAGEVTEFDPTWIVWIPAGQVQVGGGVPRVGSSATDEVFVLPPCLTGIRPSEGVRIPDLSGQRWQLTIGAASSPVQSIPLVDPPLLAAFAAQFGADAPETVTATLSLEAPMLGWAVPSSSVLVGPSGGHCVMFAESDALTAASDADDFEMREVELLAGSPPGVAWVGGPLPDSGVVLTHPTDANDVGQCA
ncbi:hypothetical protein ASF80_10560 [Microbacterium sp. Leaf159]|nr:hypothetical protein ASF80_10560 [Microbacterium sp. Leaf159]